MASSFLKTMKPLVSVKVLRDLVSKRVKKVRKTRL